MIAYGLSAEGDTEHRVATEPGTPFIVTMDTADEY